MCMLLARLTSWRFCNLGILIALTSLCTQSAAQQRGDFWLNPDYIVQQWTTQDGLPTHSIRTVLQSRDGYLWVATNDGLARFDGDQFTIFNVANTPVLPSNQILGLFEDLDGGLWIETNETSLIRYHQGQFKRFYLPGNRDATHSTFHLTRQRLWLTLDGGLFFFDEDQFHQYRPDLISGRATGVAEDVSGNLWVSLVNEGVYLFEKNQDEDEPAKLIASVDQLPVQQFGNLIADPDGGVWVAVARGAYHLTFDGVGSSVVSNTAVDDERTLLHIGEGKGLWCPGNTNAPFKGPRCELITPLQQATVRSINSAVGFPSTLKRNIDGSLWYGDDTSFYLDQELVYRGLRGGNTAGFFVDERGGFWVKNRFSGLLRIQKAPLQTIANDFESSDVYPILEDRAGRVWMISSGRLLYYDQSMRPHLVDEVWLYGSLYEERRGTLWVSSTEAMCQIEQDSCVEELGRNRFHVMYEDRQGRYWAGGTRLFVRQKVNGLDTWTLLLGSMEKPGDRHIRDILELRDGTLLFATRGNGLLRFIEEEDLDEDSFESLTKDTGLPTNNIRDLYEDEEGYVWIATTDRGLCRLTFDDRKTLADAALACINSRSGLYWDGLHRILEDDYGRFWFNTNNGIFWVERSALQAFFEGKRSSVHSVNYTETHGMAHREGNGGWQPAGIKASDGRLWFPTRHGVVIVNPADIPRPEPPPAIIESVTLGDTTHVVWDDIEPGKEKDIAFQYAAIEFDRPEGVRFQFFLDGYDEDWRNGGTQRQIAYTNLAPGEYTFSVRAGVGNQWGTPATLSFVREPFFWETRWIFGLVVFFFSIVGPTIYWYRVRQLRKRETALEQVVAERTAELKQANELKSRFLANISHEFRTPLTLTFGPLDDLLQGRFKVEEAARPYLENARRNGSKILRLINQLLDLSKLDAGALLLRVKQYDLAQHIRQITALFESLAETREIDFVIQIPDEPFYHVYDADKLEKVVINLLSNAFKFTPKGGKVSIALDQKEDDVAEIKIADTGVGISKEHLPHLFDRFYQVESDTKRSYEGTGIGLALVKELVELHEGTIEVKSTAGFGTSFLVQIPSGESTDMIAETNELSAEPDVLEYGEFNLEPEAIKQLPTSDQSATDTHQSHILVIEDNPDMRTYIRGHLDESYTIIEAENGRIGVEKAIEMVPDLILSDVMMPEMDGLEACAAIKADERTSHIPVILLTARAQVEHRIAGFESGADAYLPKPFNARELLVRVRTLIEDRRKLRERFVAWSQEPKTESVEESVARNDQVEQVKAETQVPPSDAPVPVPLPPREVAFLKKVEALIDEHLGNSQFGLDQMAEALMMSRRQLQRKMRALTNEGPTAMLRQKRLAKAAALLKTDDMTIKEVCFAVGFQSKSSFARAFREVYGLSPSEYREQ